MATIIGTADPDRLAGNSDSPFVLKGLAGDDTYTLRLFQITVLQPFGAPSRVEYRRDQVVEAPGGGHDTVTLVNYYSNVGFTGITPTGSVDAKELAGIEHVIASLTRRGDKAVGWNITAGGENNAIDAPDSADTLAGGKGNDRINAKGGDDKLFGQDGADSLFGGSGDDTLDGGAGKDTLDGGSGRDTANFSSESKGISVDLGAGQSSTQDKLRSIEAIVGTRNADKLAGSSRDDSLSGEKGNDNLSGREGADTLLGGQGDDTLDGGSGNDLLDGGGGTDRLSGGGGRDQFQFEFDTKRGVDSSHRIVYSRETVFKDTILDFQDGVDRIVIGQFDARSGLFGLFNLRDLYVEQIGKDTRLYFGSPDNGSQSRSYDDLYFGSVTLKNFDHTHLTAADFLFL